MKNKIFKPLVYIVRHGETLWNKEKKLQGQTNDIPLSNVGIDQMRYISSHLELLNYEWIAILSPMLRAQQSFNVINDRLKIPIENVFILKEMKEMNFGDFEGQKKENIMKHSFFEKRKNDKGNTAYPNGESYEDLYNRVFHSEFLKIVKSAHNSFKETLI